MAIAIKIFYYIGYRGEETPQFALSQNLSIHLLRILRKHLKFSAIGPGLRAPVDIFAS